MFYVPLHKQHCVIYMYTLFFGTMVTQLVIASSVLKKSINLMNTRDKFYSYLYRSVHRSILFLFCKDTNCKISLSFLSFILGKMGKEEGDRVPKSTDIGWSPGKFIPTCTIPKKGLISLTTTPQHDKDHDKDLMISTKGM